MTDKDSITVICGWLDDVPSRAKLAREFMDKLLDENAELGIKNESHKAELDELVECLEQAINGEEWLLESHPEATGKDDEVKLEEWKAVVSKHHKKSK